MRVKHILHRLTRPFGILSLILGLGLAFCWFYLLSPLRHMSDMRWRDTHTEKRYWEEVQKSIARIGWTHDCGPEVGRYGDKEWAAWIIAHILPGDDIESCSAGHKDGALRCITNQNVGGAAEAWLRWWQDNRDKTQEQWILQGFRKDGLELHTPLTKEDITALLLIIGKTGRDSEAHPYPYEWRYNAFRLLRDSDFEPSSFTLDALPAKDRDVGFAGLIRFAERAGYEPKQASPGVLAIGTPVSDDYACPAFASGRFNAVVCAILALLIAGGLLCLHFSLRNRLKRKDASSEAGVGQKGE
jgi:hypothetical protein